MSPTLRWECSGPLLRGARGCFPPPLWVHIHVASLHPPSLPPKPGHGCLRVACAWGQPEGSPCCLWLREQVGWPGGTPGGDNNWGLVAAVVTLSPFPPQASAFPLKVSVTPQAGSCAPSPVLILLCARCSAIITSPCPDLIVHTVSATAPRQEQPWGAAGLGPFLNIFGEGIPGGDWYPQLWRRCSWCPREEGTQLAAAGSSEHGAGWAGNDAQGWKKLPFPPDGGRKVRDGVWLQRAELGPGTLLAK